MSLSLAGLDRPTISAHLQSPDMILDEQGNTTPQVIIPAILVSLTGSAVFFGLIYTAIALARNGGFEPSLLSVLAVPPLTALLTFPPLYLACSVRQRLPDIPSLIGLACSGPIIAGTTLGASSPLVLLYLLTGELNAGFGLLVVGLVMLSVLMGGIGARRNAMRIQARDPGRLIVIGHYLLTLWTALVLSIHLI